MTVKKKGNTMPWGDRERGQLIWVTSPTPREYSPRSGYLEDPDEGRPAHVGIKEMKLYRSDANDGKCDSEIVSSVETQLFEKVARA